MDGIAVLRGLNRLDPAIPVHSVTGLPPESSRPLREARDAGLRLGMADKPHSGDRIRKIVGATPR